MAKCGSCGNETARIITHFQGRDGKQLPTPVDSCPQCKPDEFPQGPVLAPSDRRFYGNWEANPNEYDTLFFDDGEVVPIVKDWARGEFEDRVAEGPVAKAEEAEAIEKRKAFARERNQRPMTPNEIQRTVDYYKKQAEEVERAHRAMDAGIILLD